MKAIVSSSRTPFLNVPNSSSPWKRNAPTTLLPRAASQPRRPEPRGFSGGKSTPVATKEDKSKGEPGGDREIPQEVFERMMVRIAVSVGAPMAAGLGAMKFFGAVKGEMAIPVWVQFATVFFAFGLSSAGLAYGALSSSWDAESKGSLLGLEEIQRNWGDMWREEDENNSKGDQTT